MENEKRTNKQCDIPILFLIFNRPSTTGQVFDQIREIGPQALYIAADGPRSHIAGEDQLCRQTRDIADKIDWDCDIRILFRERNLGCRMAISSAIDWFFSEVDEGIILEDDCLPDPSFFRYCGELLARYRDDERIMTISGANLHFGKRFSGDSYYFSRYFHVWGWASWRRAWRHYDCDMSLWPEIREKGYLGNIFPDRRSLRYWERLFDLTCQGKINTWDYQWVLACWIQGAHSIVPDRNLVSNIGFGSGSTHTKGVNKYATMPAVQMDFPLQHPRFFFRNDMADRLHQKTLIRESSLLYRAMSKLVRFP